MKIIGITGGIGMGKSTAGDLLLQRGLPVLDTDSIAREMVEPGQPALNEIVDRFGGDVVGKDGKLRRDALATIVFADPQARLALERILHPRIRKAWEEKVSEWRTNINSPTHGFVLIPLLFETGASAAFDATVCVACSENSQMERLKRRGWSESEIAARKAAQWPVPKKMDASTFVVWTDTSLAVHGAQLEQIVSA